MRWERVRIVIGKDWKGYRQSKELIVPMIVLPIMFAVFLPSIFLVPLTLGLPIVEEEPAPPWFLETFPNLTETEVFALFVAKAMSVPFLLFLPIILSMAMASDSFAGEKERGTIEQLLATPLTDEELFFGKVLACMLPSFAVTLLSFGVFSTIVDVATYRTIGRLLLPDAATIGAALITSPLFSLLSIGTMVLVSLRVRRVRDAQQLGGLVMLPGIAIVLASITGIVVLSGKMILAVSIVLFFVDSLLIKASSKCFNRDRLITSLI